MIEFLLNLELGEVDETVDALESSKDDLKEIIKLLIFEIHGGVMDEPE